MPASKTLPSTVAQVGNLRYGGTDKMRHPANEPKILIGDAREEGYIIFLRANAEF